MGSSYDYYSQDEGDSSYLTTPPRSSGYSYPTSRSPSGASIPSSSSPKVLVSNGLVCEDDPRVEDFGVKCKLIARSLGGRLGCEKKLSEIAPDGQLPPSIPSFSRVADACPLTCGLCEECAPGCALWFLGNTLCDEACNNSLCQFDGGDCWSADCVETREGCNAGVKCPDNCVVSEWSAWSDCSTTCGEGQSRRHRDILKHPDTLGERCPEIEQSRVCMKDSCTRPCVVSEWGEWGACGASCGGGIRTRKRSILSPPINGGDICPSLTDDEV
ncbi:thrombospondin type 1 domain-containing, partial [Cystoisospora suis]